LNKALSASLLQIRTGAVTVSEFSGSIIKVGVRDRAYKKISKK